MPEPSGLEENSPEIAEKVRRVAAITGFRNRLSPTKPTGFFEESDCPGYEEVERFVRAQWSDFKRAMENAMINCEVIHGNDWNYIVSKQECRLRLEVSVAFGIDDKSFFFMVDGNSLLEHFYWDTDVLARIEQAFFRLTDSVLNAALVNDN